MTSTEIRSFFLLLPEEFVQVDLGELTEERLLELASQIAGVFDVPDNDLGAVASAITLGSLGAAAAVGGASHLSVGIYRSPDEPRPIMVLVSCYVMMSDHESVQTAISGLLEVHESQQRGLVRTVQLDSGPAVTVEAKEASEITFDGEVFDVTQHTLTAWIPEPNGTCVVAVSVSSSNTEDWEHVRDLATGIFNAFMWEPVYAA